MKKLYLKIFIAAFIAFFPISVFAAGTCWNGGSSGTSPWTVKDGDGGSNSAAYDDVSYCISTVASDGETVLIPSDSETWSSTITIPSSKKLTIKGAGALSTILTSAGVTFFDTNDSGSEISNIKFIFSSKFYDPQIETSGYVLIHDCEFEYTPSTGSCVAISGTTKTTGVIYNNEFYETRIIQQAAAGFYTICSYMDEDYQFGTANTVFIEDNYFYKVGTSNGNSIDCNRGSEFVLRFNTFEGTTQVQAHSLQADNERGPRSWEIYNNTMICTDSTWGATFLRGGTGYIFNNVYDTDYTYPFVFDNRRSFASFGDAGQCDGNSDWDSNEASYGWLCRDQIGAGKDTSQWTAENQYPAQEKKPTYIWGNVESDETAITSIYIHNSCDNWIQSDRDYFISPSSFDGSTGVGVGTASEMALITPTTIGVGFWVTDEADWNNDKPGNDGQLYVWDGDSWELDYTPYTYPHPSRGSGNSGGGESGDVFGDDDDITTDTDSGGSSGCFIRNFFSLPNR